MTRNELLDLAWKTGRCGRDKYEVLYEAAQQFPTTTTLAIGVHTGGAAMVLAGLSNIVYCVDPWEREDFLQQFLTNLREQPFAHRAVLHRCTSNMFFKAYPSLKFDLAFVDGDHGYDGFKADLLTCAARCKMTICDPRPDSARAPDKTAATRAIRDLSMQGHIHGYYSHGLYLFSAGLPATGRSHTDATGLDDPFSSESMRAGELLRPGTETPHDRTGADGDQRGEDRPTGAGAEGPQD